MTSGTSFLQRPVLASSPSRYVTVVDVYDLAESINHDFECIAQKYGKDIIEGIVKKVICALETLEALAKNNDSDNAEIVNLQKTIEHMEHEKQQRIRDKNTMEKDIVDLEENYKKEIDELCRVVKSLQSENRNIKRRLEEVESAEENRSGSMSPEPGIVSVREDEFQMMIDLRSTSMKQREQIKDLQRDVDNYCCEVENLQNNIEKLIRQNKELLRKNASLQKQGRLLVQERADLQRRSQKTEEANFQLRRMLNKASRACADLEAERQYELEGDNASPRFSLEELREVLQEKTLLKARVLELEEQLDFYRGPSTSSAASISALDQDLENLSASSSVGCVNTTSTISKQAANSHEDLSFYIRDPSISPTPATSSLLEKPPTTNKLAEARYEKSTDECLVYGPINREPEEKLNPLKYERKDSGVRKLFRFFKELNSSSPRRASSNMHLAGGGNSGTPTSLSSSLKPDDVA